MLGVIFVPLFHKAVDIIEAVANHPWAALGIGGWILIFFYLTHRGHKAYKARQ